MAFNQAYGHLVGRSPAEASAFYLADVTHEEDREAVAKALDQLPSGAHLEVHLTRRTFLPSGTFRWVREVYSLQQARPGGDSQIVALSISNHAEQIAKQALEEVGDPLGFARGIALTLKPAVDLSYSLENLVSLLADPQLTPATEIGQHLAQISGPLTRAIRQTFFAARKKYLGS